MKIIFARLKNSKAKIMMTGTTLDSLTLSVAICKELARKIAAEKNISIEKAKTTVLDSIKDGMQTVR